MDEQEQEPQVEQPVEDYPSTGVAPAPSDLAWSSASDEETQEISYRGRSVSAALAVLVCVIAVAVGLLVSTFFDSGSAVVVSSKTTEPSVISASELPSIPLEAPESPTKPLDTPLAAVPDADHMVPPPPPQESSSSGDQDDEYLSLLRHHDGLNIVNPVDAVNAGHQICAVIARPDQPTLRQVITWLQQSAGVSHDIAEDYVLAANVVYCPQFDNP
jgi:Protein of unknown function (DUF732)